jgi:hypothetical protein
MVWNPANAEKMCSADSGEEDGKSKSPERSGLEGWAGFPLLLPQFVFLQEILRD